MKAKREAEAKKSIVSDTRLGISSDMRLKSVETVELQVIRSITVYKNHNYKNHN